MQVQSAPLSPKNNLFSPLFRLPANFSTSFYCPFSSIWWAPKVKDGEKVVWKSESGLNKIVFGETGADCICIAK